ncbi:hypothetical protein JVT61DRAFT_10125 [Boletus reticuloceps]|uniref:Uncharacterized protein n=1 Tax=Boletus reticuloceps TaxID=495285 RepID=A0A8I2YW87_9AGAM|nr:hypothetical protein JVT61DRAFT_10125 [Boletus reticuloceps]
MSSQQDPYHYSGTSPTYDESGSESPVIRQDPSPGQFWSPTAVTGDPSGYSEHDQVGNLSEISEVDNASSHSFHDFNNPISHPSFSDPQGMDYPFNYPGLSQPLPDTSSQDPGVGVDATYIDVKPILSSTYPSITLHSVMNILSIRAIIFLTQITTSNCNLLHTIHTSPCTGPAHSDTSGPPRTYRSIHLDAAWAWGKRSEGSGPHRWTAQPLLSCGNFLQSEVCTYYKPPIAEFTRSREEATVHRRRVSCQCCIPSYVPQYSLHRSSDHEEWCPAMMKHPVCISRVLSGVAAVIQKYMGEAFRSLKNATKLVPSHHTTRLTPLSSSFNLENQDQIGIPIIDILNKTGGFARIRDRTEAFNMEKKTFTLRVRWPGYKSWSKTIAALDWTKLRAPVTRVKLAEAVATAIRDLFEVNHN